MVTQNDLTCIGQYRLWRHYNLLYSSQCLVTEKKMGKKRIYTYYYPVHNFLKVNISQITETMQDIRMSWSADGIISIYSVNSHNNYVIKTTQNYSVVPKMPDKITPIVCNANSK